MYHLRKKRKAGRFYCLSLFRKLKENSKFQRIFTVSHTFSPMLLILKIISYLIYYSVVLGTFRLILHSKIILVDFKLYPQILMGARGKKKKIPAKILRGFVIFKQQKEKKKVHNQIKTLVY